MTIRNQRGFTTIELGIVFVVIVILSSVIYVNYHSLRLKERDSQRKDDIVKLQRELESYQAEFGYYPTLSDMNNMQWRGKYLKGFDSSILEDPLGTAPQLVSTPEATAYAYQPTPNGCDNSVKDKLCTAYTLTATLESGSTYIQKNFN